MTRLVSFFTCSIVILSIATLWLLKMVDQTRSLFPTELPERPPEARKFSLAQRLSQKLASTKNKRNGSIDITPSCSSDGYTPVGYTSIVPITNITSGHDLSKIDTDGAKDGRTQPASNTLNSIDNHDINGSSAVICKKPVPLIVEDVVEESLVERFKWLRIPQVGESQPRPCAPAVSRNTEGSIKDSLVERFEWLRLPRDGQPSPRPCAPIVPLPLPHSASISPPLKSMKHRFQAIKSGRGTKAAPRSSLQVPEEEPSAEHRSGFISRLRKKADETNHIVIEDNSDLESHDRARAQASYPFQRRMQTHKRLASPTEHRTTYSSQILRRRSRSPTLSDRTSEGNLTPDDSEDAAYPELLTLAAEAEELRQLPHASSPSRNRFLDSEDAANLQEHLDRKFALQLQQQEEEQLEQALHAQLWTATSQPTITQQCAGTQEDPLDPNSDSYLASDYLDQVIFTGRGGGFDKAADHAEPMELDEDNWYQIPNAQLHTPQTTLDAELAQLLQEEEQHFRQASAGTRECAVCGDRCPIYEIPSLAQCEHVPRTCADCYSGWITAQLQESGWKEAKCPEGDCKVKLTYYELQQIASPEVFGQFDNFIARTAISEDPNFRWCRACDSGQIHLSGEEGNIFTCASCGHKVCIIHENTWHEGETCEEFEYRSSGRKERDQRAQEAASLKAIGELSKKCPGPNCVYSIEKNDGCDHMTCSKCRYEFCWICLCDYNRVRALGNTAHAVSCKYHTGRLPM